MSRSEGHTQGLALHLIPRFSGTEGTATGARGCFLSPSTRATACMCKMAARGSQGWVCAREQNSCSYHSADAKDLTPGPRLPSSEC